MTVQHRDDGLVVDLVRVPNTGCVYAVGQCCGVVVDGDARYASAVVQHEMRGQVLQRGANGRRVSCKSPGNTEGLEIRVLADQQPEVGALRSPDTEADHSIHVWERRTALGILEVMASQACCSQDWFARYIETCQHVWKTTKRVEVYSRHGDGVRCRAFGRTLLTGLAPHVANHRMSVSKAQGNAPSADCGYFHWPAR